MDSPSPRTDETITAWTDPRLRREVLFSDRVVACIEGRPTGLQAMLDAAVESRGEHEALVAGGRRLTWRQVEAEAAALAGGLARAGVGPGDRICLMLRNGAPFVLALFAAARLGAVSVPLSAREEGPGLTHALRHSGAKVLIYEPDLAAIIPAADQTPGLALALSIDSSAFVDLCGGDPAPAAIVDEQSPTMILYTSGTTGRPKGAVIAQVNLVHSALNYVRAMDLGPETRSLITVPMSHITGLVALIATVVCAKGALIVMDGFRAQDFLSLAASEHMTHTVMVPAMYNLCLLRADFAQYDLSDWRIAGYGGAPMPLSSIERLAATLPHLQLMNLYGATETTSPAAMMPARHAVSHLDSVGLPVAGAEIIVMDESGRETALGGIGEIWIKGPMVTPGYWDDPEATAREITGGFWRSGDIGRRDAEGFVYVLDRTKDMINRGGYKVFTAEVENLISTHPAVVECAVVGRPCDVLGERVHAAVVLKGDATLQPADLLQLLDGRLADYKTPETWAIGHALLPRNANGKILKRVLRDVLEPYQATSRPPSQT